MPEMPIARIATPAIVPHTLTRPGLIVVEPRKAPTSARQQIFETDARLPDAQTRGQQNAGEAGQRAGANKRRDGVAAYGNAIERGRLGVGADGVEIPPDRQIFQGQPEDDREREHVIAGDWQVEHEQAGEGVKAVPGRCRSPDDPGCATSRWRRAPSPVPKVAMNESIWATSTNTPLKKPNQGAERDHANNC